MSAAHEPAPHQPPREGESARAETRPPVREHAPQTPPPLEQALAEARRARRRYRRQGLPLAGITATHIAGAAADAAAGTAGLIPLGLGGTAAAGAYGYAHQRAARWGRLYAAVAAAGSVGWQASAMLAGADGAAAAVLWAGGAALALPWWRRHSEPDPDLAAENAAPPTLEPPAGQPDPRVVTWGRHLAASNQPLPKSQLADVTDMAYGWRGVVHLPTGEHWTKIIGARNAILSVYDLPDGRVFIEPLPGQSVRRARLTVLTTDPLEHTRRWTGPGLDPATGTFPLMTTVDGAVLPFRLWWPGAGACHALVSGATGSGKSACLDLILAELAFSHRYIPWIIDGGEGASNPDWIDSPAVGHVATNLVDAWKLVTYALQLAGRRKRYLRNTKRRSIDPTPDTPGIGILIDEAHNLLTQEDTDDPTTSWLKAQILRAVEKLTQEGRKVSISVILATQVPSAAQLGGSTVIRNMLKSGTVVAFRTLERTAANMAGGDQQLPEPLHQLPAEFPDGSPTYGLGYMLTNRLIRARTLYYDPTQWSAAPAPVTTLDECTAAVEPPDLVGNDPDEPDGDPRADPPAAAATTGTPTAVTCPDPIQAVQQALDAGTQRTVPALTHDTGLPIGAVRRALDQLH